jgi:hypothetical protein
MKNNYPFWKRIASDKLLLAILLAGILIRVVFFLIGAKFYYGAQGPYINGDSNSYILAFENLRLYGRYTFDFLEPGASFGRLPGYPFFYGIHSLLFGSSRAIVAVACTQTIMDCVAVYLVFSIAKKQSVARSPLTPYLAAALYAGYPFIIVWTTIIGTEFLATFFTLVWLNTLLSDSKHWGRFVQLGVYTALLFYIREFLGILLPITIIYLAWEYAGKWSIAFRNITLVGAAFLALYIWWPIRNYVSQHQIVLVKPQRAGYANYGPDMVGFLEWTQSWSNESTYWMEQSFVNPRPDFPAEVFASESERNQAYATLAKANKCGFSFYLYKNRVYNTAAYYDTVAMQRQKALVPPCNEEVKSEFDKLRVSFKERQPVIYYTRVPLQNLEKVFFKNGKVGYGSGTVTRNPLLTLLFGYRTALLLLGVVGLVVYRKAKGIGTIALFYSFIVFFLCFVFRQLEMRYLIQGDVLMLFPAALVLSALLSKLLGKRFTGMLTGADAQK